MEEVRHHSQVESLYRQQRSKEQTRIAQSSIGLHQIPQPKAVIKEQMKHRTLRLSSVQRASPSNARWFECP